MAGLEVVGRLFAVDVTRPSSTRDSTIGNDSLERTDQIRITARKIDKKNARVGGPISRRLVLLVPTSLNHGVRCAGIKARVEGKKETVAIFRGLDCQLTRPRQGSVPYDERPAGNIDLPGREAARGEV